MTDDLDEPPSMAAPSNHNDGAKQEKTGFIKWIKSLVSPKSDPSLREAIEEYIEDSSKASEKASVSAHEKTLISNILEVTDLCAEDVMIPRADIIALPKETTHQALLNFISEKQYTRIPVYKDTLDNITGTIHVKDILAALARGEKIDMNTIIRDVPIISPSMPALDLLLQMRISKKHMAIVIDEYGGVDGLVTIGDVIEAIVGEINDDYNPEEQPQIITNNDGTVMADARIELDEFENIFGKLLSEEEREENDTLGGLVFYLAGRVPARGEILTHDSGMKFEILEADPRRVNRLSIHNIPHAE